jgi:endonuclease G, mitochondrial
VFTVPLYPPQGSRWEVACGKLGAFVLSLWHTDHYPLQTHEMIGNPPNIGVPTHFAKVVLTAKPSSPATPDISEISTGAFVLPNAPIPDETPLESFVVPGKSTYSSLSFQTILNIFTVDAVERAAGLTLFSNEVKSGSKHICKSTKCQVVVRRFDDAAKRPLPRRSNSAPPTA